MTAMSAQSASKTPSPATSPSADSVPVRLPGSQRTYELRDFLRGLYLRWDPATHALHGTLAAEQRAVLERDYGLPLRSVIPIERFAAKEEPVTVQPAPSPVPTSFVPSPARRVVRDSSRTRFESRLAFGNGDEEEDGAGEPADTATDTHRFTWFETTSGLPDDSHEANDRAEHRHLVDLRSRVKIARAVASKMPGLTSILRERPDRMARFCARFGITEGRFRFGESSEDGLGALGPFDLKP
jgi:hypothetical protein